MPFVHIRVAGKEITPAHVMHLQKEATRLMATIMHKKAELTAVLVERSEHADWSIGGQSVPVAGHFDVKVTAGTNTAEEKAAFVAHANKLLREVLGPELPVATYVVIHEIGADAWGYDGRTQEARRLSVDPVKRSTVEPSVMRRTGVPEMLMAVVRLITFQPRTQ
ncbi:tautomerase family protein [Agrobacterium tumefaciens]|uniref:4-oxalocrotonate tautomerase n=1 Tax=Agrobacterium tumefaciens TaxID=358 RepID=A0AA44F6X5_AGRTU|nr:tautomerase family protein [Agrobacterium tumefaciens]NTB87676.1 4-oxalocrotonate tautomerase [Agrobacterium tumefaciens]NTC19956.1 4-oxalocrotonate tautomerase [Agrobacterium tumefaciens]NTC29775.1 4-oxalocrotonate tautomerase [Agrobacterium tumefaciens]